MKKAAAILVLTTAMLGLAGCGVGPCEGYGCPAFSARAGQAPQPATKATLGNGAAETAHANSGAATAADSGQ